MAILSRKSCRVTVGSAAATQGPVRPKCLFHDVSCHRKLGGNDAQQQILQDGLAEPQRAERPRERIPSYLACPGPAGATRDCTQR